MAIQRRVRAIDKSETVASIVTGISASKIGRCCKGKQSVAGGHKWKYGEKRKQFKYELAKSEE